MRIVQVSDTHISREHGPFRRNVAAVRDWIERQAVFGGVSHVWCPSAAFVCGPIQVDVPGERRIGAAIHELTPGGVASRIVHVPGTEDLPIDPHLDAIYPAPTALEAARP